MYDSIRFITVTVTALAQSTRSPRGPPFYFWVYHSAAAGQRLFNANGAVSCLARLMSTRDIGSAAILRRTLTSGQAFGWHSGPDGVYTGVVSGHVVVSLREKDGAVQWALRSARPSDAAVDDVTAALEQYFHLAVDMKALVDGWAAADAQGRLQPCAAVRVVGPKLTHRRNVMVWGCSSRVRRRHSRASAFFGSHQSSACSLSSYRRTTM